MLKVNVAVFAPVEVGAKVQVEGFAPPLRIPGVVSTENSAVSPLPETVLIVNGPKPIVVIEKLKLFDVPTFFPPKESVAGVTVTLPAISSSRNQPALSPPLANLLRKPTTETNNRPQRKSYSAPLPHP